MNFLSIKKLNLKNKLISLSIFFLILNFGLFYFLILPTISRIKSQRDEILNLKIDLENKVTRERNMSDLNQKIKKIEPQLEKLNQIFVNQNREIEFITSLEELEKKYSVSQRLNLEINNMQKNEGFNKVPINIVASGNFTNIINYLVGIESLNYYIDINGITIGKEDGASQDQQNPKVNMKISGYTYWK